MSKNYAIIVAAGRGTRIGAGINKQFINIKDKPMLYYSLRTFSYNKYIDGIILVCAEDEIEYCKENIIYKYDISKVLKIVAGGKERQESVLKGLMAIDDCEIVLIHDGARPFVNDDIIENGIKYAETYGACTCGISIKDTIKAIDSDGFCSGTIDRNRITSVQTPQCFKYNLIFSCHKKLAEEKIKVTDDTTVVEHCGNRVYLYEGSYDNIKMTTPEDLYMAEMIVDKMKLL
jgi:2-C-methyl-D-erythritol 4-phosphate cytidylyltransferase